MIPAKPVGKNAVLKLVVKIWIGCLGKEVAKGVGREQRAGPAVIHPVLSQLVFQYGRRGR